LVTFCLLLYDPFLHIWGKDVKILTHPQKYLKAVILFYVFAPGFHEDVQVCQKKKKPHHITIYI